MVHAESLAARLPSSVRDRLILATSTVIVAALLIAAGLFVYHAVAPTTQITAYFSETIGVYPGSDGANTRRPGRRRSNSVTPDGTQGQGDDDARTRGVPVPADAGSRGHLAQRGRRPVRPAHAAAYTRRPEAAVTTPSSRSTRTDGAGRGRRGLRQHRPSSANALGPDGANTARSALFGLLETGAAEPRPATASAMRATASTELGQAFPRHWAGRRATCSRLDRATSNLSLR